MFLLGFASPGAFLADSRKFAAAFGPIREGERQRGRQRERGGPRGAQESPSGSFWAPMAQKWDSLESQNARKGLPGFREMRLRIPEHFGDFGGTQKAHMRFLGFPKIPKGSQRFLHAFPMCCSTRVLLTRAILTSKGIIRDTCTSVWSIEPGYSLYVTPSTGK